MNNKQVKEQRIKSQQELNKMLGKNHLFLDECKIVALGYLEFGEPFEKGIVSTSFLTKLDVLWNEGRTLGALGHHECEFCIDEGNYKDRGLSNEEKELVDRVNKVRYLFPRMIFHYIKKHGFKPSDQFIEFVMMS